MPPVPHPLERNPAIFLKQKKKGNTFFFTKTGSYNKQTKNMASETSN